MIRLFWRTSPPLLLLFVLLAHLGTATALVATEPIQDIFLRLNDPSPIRRYEAVEALGSLGTPESITALIRLTAEEDYSWLAVRQLVILKDVAAPYLMEALNDPDIDIIKFAIYCLGELKHRPALNDILKYRNHPDPEIRQNVVFALGFIKDPKSAIVLVEKLQDPDNVVREYAAAALDYYGDQSTIPCLRDALKKEKGSFFNMAATLYHLGAEDVIDLLLEKLRDPEATNRLYAVYALGKISDVREVEPLIDSLSDENVQWLAAKALINLGEKAVPSLIKALSRKDHSVRLYATYTLGEIADSRAAKSLIDNLIDPDPLVSDYTAEALIKIDDKSVIPKLLYYIEKGDCAIQSQALRVLGVIGDVSAIVPISNVISCPFPQVRMNAAYALGELKEPNAIPILVKMLGDEDTTVSTAAANALIKIGRVSADGLLESLPMATGRTETGIIYILGKLKDKRVVDYLIKRLSSEDYLVRRFATIALTEIADPKAEEYLVTHLNDPDPYVRMYASVGLMEIGGRLSVKLLLNALRTSETRWLAVRILDKIGPRAVDELIAALNDKNLQWVASETLIKLDGAVLPQLEQGLKSDEEVIRNNIALILGEVKDKRAVTALVNAMKDEKRLVSLAASSLVNIGDASAVEPLLQCLQHQNEQVRLYAAYALGHLKDLRAVDPLIQVLKDKDSGVRGIAAYSLGLLHAKKATVRLIETMNDPDENVRLSAIYALGKIGDPLGTPFIKERYQYDASQKVRKAAQETLEMLASGMGNP